MNEMNYIVVAVLTLGGVALLDVQPWQKRWSKAPTREVWTDCAVL